MLQAHSTRPVWIADHRCNGRHATVSARTLVRRLRRVGTTYHELVDTYRREQAETLLRNPDFGIVEVSYLVGYEDPANFGRACRRWFGIAPGNTAGSCSTS